MIWKKDSTRVTVEDKSPEADIIWSEKCITTYTFCNIVISRITSDYQCTPKEAPGKKSIGFK